MLGIGSVGERLRSLEIGWLVVPFAGELVVGVVVEDVATVAGGVEVVTSAVVVVVVVAVAGRTEGGGDRKLCIAGRIEGTEGESGM